MKIVRGALNHLGEQETRNWVKKKLVIYYSEIMTGGLLHSNFVTKPRFGLRCSITAQA